MLRMRSCILTRLLSSPAAPSISPLHRLLSAAAAAPAASPSPAFAVEQYLVDTCGLTRAQAFKASTKLTHLKSPTNPNAVLAFLAGLGLSRADIAAVVAKDPKFLCTGVERALASTVTDLTGLGLSHTEIARLVILDSRLQESIRNLRLQDAAKQADGKTRSGISICAIIAASSCF